METLHHITRIAGRLFPAALMAVLFAGCDLVQEEPALDEQRAEAAAEIIASALVQQQEGLLSDVSDLTADVGQDGIYYARAAGKSNGGDPEGYQKDYSAAYDPETGTHTIHYKRSVVRGDFQKSLEADLQYIFYSVDGGFLAFPRHHWDKVTRIDFAGTRTGSTSGVDPHHPDHRRYGAFERAAQWTITGIDSLSPSMTLSGEQTHEGTHRITVVDTLDGSERTVAERTFSMRMATEEATLLKPSEEIDAARQLSGVLSYEVTVTEMRDGETRTRTHQGTIEFDGNGQALLRFMGLRKAFVIDLREGRVESDHTR